jgi:DNA-binding NarL/FixJ family response regulator
MPSPDARTAVVLVDDLFFESKIRACAESVGTRLVVARGVRQLEEALAREVPAVVVVDLDTHGADVVEALSAARRADPAPRTIAYGSHVQANLLQAARDAGADEVMPRSRFAQRLAELLG